MLRTMLLFSTLGLFACNATNGAEAEGGEDPEAAAPVFASHTKEVLERAWTDRFEAPAILVADEIVIEGPPDLIQHIAVTQDPQVLVSTTRTVPEGLLQETRVREGVVGREVRAQLDAWTIVAMKRMRVLQRPGDVPVTVQATGSALLRPVEGEELRRPTITVRGQHRR